MTKRDFFLLVIKLAGLILFFLFALNLFTIMISGSALMFFEDFSTGTLISGLYALVFIALALFLLKQLLQHSGKIVDLLGLNKGYEDEWIKMDKLDEPQLMKIGLTLVGVFLVTFHLIDLIQVIVSTFVNTVHQKEAGGIYDISSLLNQNSNLPGYGWWDLTYPIVQIVVGILLIRNSHYLSGIIVGLSKSNQASS